MNTAALFHQLASSRSALTLTAAVLYFLVALSSQFLSIPPGFASAAWPAAGIGLAFVLRFGPGALPGLFLGSLIYNIYARLDMGIDAIVLVNGTMMAIGSALQSYVAWRLVATQTEQGKFFLKERELLRLYVLAGPLACLTSASVACATLFFSVDMPLEALGRTWFTWYIGDTIGTLTVLPVYLLLKYNGNIHNTKQSLRVIAPYLSIFLLILFVFDYTRSLELEKNQRKMDQQSSMFVLAIDKHINYMANSVHGLHAFAQAHDQLGYVEFSLYVENVLSNYSGIQALEWVPKILHWQRADLEEKIRQSHPNHIGITERTSAGALVPALVREVYYPVQHISPIKGNESALGYDLGSQATRLEALQQASRSGDAVSTARIRLVQGEKPDESFGLLLIKPVYINPFMKRETRGYILAVLDIGNLIEAALAGLESQGHELEVFDVTDPGNPEWLYSRSDQRIDSQAFTQVIEVSGRQWEFRSSPSRNLILSEQGWSVWMVLIGGLVLVSISGVFIFTINAKAGAIRREVIEKTRELRIAKNHAESANKAKSDFLASMSHELRTPLNSIIGFTKRLLSRADDNADPKTIDAIEIVHRNGVHLLSLITDILDLSKIEAGKMSIQREIVSLENLAIELQQQLSSLIPPEKQQNIICTREADFCFADRKRLFQILINLTSNAIKYSDGGDIVIKVTASLRKGVDGVAFAIIDHGLGIREENIPKLFQKFSQINTDGSNHIEGTGLGLVLVRELAELHGGDISVESVWQEGSTFTLWLPNKENMPKA